MTSMRQLSRIDGKPNCFAKPDQFHIVRPCCERCESQVDCGLAIEQLGLAIQRNKVAVAGMLRAKVYLINRHLDSWDNRPPDISLDVAPELLEVLAARAVAFDLRRVSEVPPPQPLPTLVDSKSDKTMDTILEDLRDFSEVDETSADCPPLAYVIATDKNSSLVDEPTQTLEPLEILDQLDVSHPSPKQATDATLAATDMGVPSPVSQAKTVYDATCSDTPSELKYQFTVASERPYQHLSFDELKAEWVAGIERGFGGPLPAGYSAVREAVCAISIELNDRATWAPRFRGWPSKVSTADRGLFGLDRQVIDCHWLAVRYPNHDVANEAYENILRNDPFDFELASRFAVENWHWHTKAVYLNLNTSMEWELSVIQSEAVRKDWLRYREGDKSGAAVRSMGVKQISSFLMGSTKHIRLVPAWAEVWLAAKIAGKNWVKAEALHSLMTGEMPIDRRQFAKTHETIMSKLRNGR